MILEWSPSVGAGEALVAGGTIALAWFTWRLARQTRADVALTAKSIEAADMPYVIAVSPPDHEFRSGPTLIFGQAGEHGWVEFALSNVGKGPAIVNGVQLELDVPEGRKILEPFMEHLPLAAGAMKTVQVSTRWQPNWKPAAGAPAVSGQLRVAYSHASGSQYATVSEVRASGRYVNCTTFRRCEAAELPAIRDPAPV